MHDKIRDEIGLCYKPPLNRSRSGSDICYYTIHISGRCINLV